MHRFRCPECGCEHDQPAEAAFVVTVICLDCALLSDLHIGRAQNEVVPSAQLIAAA